MPKQTRSRDRVERILEVAEQLVVAGGVESMSTRAIAAAADVPVASLYQYFADKEAILLALVERDMAELDAQVAEDIGGLEVLNVRALVQATMYAFVKIYRRHPAFVMIYMRGRTNPAIRDYCRRHNRRMAGDLFALARRAGMVLEPTGGLHAELALEVSDRVFQLAFEKAPDGDLHVIEEGVSMLTTYLESHATTQGIEGVQR